VAEVEAFERLTFGEVSGPDAVSELSGSGLANWQRAGRTWQQASGRSAAQTSGHALEQAERQSASRATECGLPRSLGGSLATNGHAYSALWNQAAASRAEASSTNAVASGVRSCYHEPTQYQTMGHCPETGPIPGDGQSRPPGCVRSKPSATQNS